MDDLPEGPGRENRVIGKAAPASPENFSAEPGRKFAYEDAIRRLWPLMGYALKERLTKGSDAA